MDSMAGGTQGTDEDARRQRQQRRGTAQPELHPAADDDVETGVPCSTAGIAGSPLPVIRLHAWPSGSKQPIAGAVAVARRHLAVQRWRRACRAVMEGREVSRCTELLGTRLAPADDRLHAVFALHMRIAACPHALRQCLTHALFTQRLPGSVSLGDHLLNEFYITGGCCLCGVVVASGVVGAAGRRHCVSAVPQ